MSQDPSQQQKDALSPVTDTSVTDVRPQVTVHTEPNNGVPAASTVVKKDKVINPKGMRVRDLDIYYGSHKAVQDVNIEIEPGLVTALIGPSGCGKSTVLRCLNRMHELIPGAYAKGEVLFEGTNIYDPEVDPVAVRRMVGMVFQRPNPFPTMSIYDNVAAGLRLAGINRGHSLDDVVEHSLKQAGLWGEVKDRLKRAGSSLSGGQQQRLCIARAIAVEPAVLLMDEPCSALDPGSTLRIEELIREIRSEYTVVIVTHNMQQAARVSDVTAFMTILEEGTPGRLVETGPTTTIFSAPKEKATEDYITGRFG